MLMTMTIILGTLFSSCREKREKTVAILISSETVARYVTESQYIQKRCKELGIKTILLYSKNDEALQVRQAMELIDKVDGLCINSVNANTAAEIVRAYNQAGKPVIAYSRLIYNCKPDYYIAGDNEHLAGLMVNTALQHKPKGNYYLIGGDKFDLNGLQLQEAIDSILRPHVEAGDINIIFRTLTEDWNPEVAKYDLEKAINLSTIKPDAIIAAYDGMAEAAVDVMKKLYGSVGDVVITGQDAELRAIRSIAKGEQTMTAYHSSKNYGYACAETIASLLNGKKIPTSDITYTFNGAINVPTVKTQSILVTKENIEQVIIKDNVHSASDIYN